MGHAEPTDLARAEGLARYGRGSVISSADEASAKYTGTPYELISALGKLDTYSKCIPMKASPSTAHLFIIKPLTGQWFMNLSRRTSRPKTV